MREAWQQLPRLDRVRKDDVRISPGVGRAWAGVGSRVLDGSDKWEDGGRENGEKGDGVVVDLEEA